MDFLRFLKSKTLWINVGLSVVATIALLFLTQWILESYTRSGRIIMVPDLQGQLTTEVEETLANSELQLELIDSIYAAGARPGGIVDQIPAAGKKVKKGRKIYVTINAFSKETTVMPELVNFSYRNAQVNLQNAGLVLGNVSHRPSPYTDLVLEQNVDGKPIKSGSKLPKGTAVDIVVAQGGQGGLAVIPNVVGKKADEARTALTNARFYVGNVEYDNSVHTAEDSARATVYRQIPSSSSEPVESWTSVHIWLTADVDKAVNAVIDQE